MGRFRLLTARRGVSYTCAALLLLSVVYITPVPALAETSIIPLPVYATSRNEGNDFGVMPVFMMKDPSEYVYAIIAPSIIYNGTTGTNFTFRYLGYPTVDKNYRIFVNRATKVDQEYTGEYWDNKFLDGKFRLYIRGSFSKDSTSRFFGLTELSSEDNETNYTDSEFYANVALGYYLPNNFIISYGERLRSLTLRRGKVKDLPFIKSRFPRLEGINGGTALDRRATLTYDTRDDEVFPTGGWYNNLYGEIGQSFAHTRTYTRAGIDIRKYYSMYDGRFITVVKGAVELTGGRKVPFFEQSTIGGENTLRGFGISRFTDDGFVLLNVEERIRLFKLHIFGVWSDWEAAPFLDLGRVYSSFAKAPLKHYEANPGLGFRAIVKPNVVGRVDFGYGKEGLNAFVGLDFPF